MSLTRAEIDAWKEELRLEGQACEGFTDGVLAAVVHIITKAAGISNGFALDAAAAAGDVIRIVRGI